MARPKVKVKNNHQNHIVYKRNLSIGSPDAETDTEYLDTCFFETEDIDTLLDTFKPERIVVGRTGSGKTALLKKIYSLKENAVFLSPEDFSFKYLADSSVIKFFEEAGVNLNIFYLLLWRHIICVELIKKKYNITSEDKKTIFLNKIAAFTTGNTSKKLAYEYLEKWGDEFWKTTETRVKEIAVILETQLSAKLKYKENLVQLGAEGARKLTQEQKLEVISIGKDVVNQIQMNKLTEIINFLNEDIFDDDKNKYYILIDDLDTNWATDNLRYKIIRALMDTVKKFQSVRNVKIIVSLREDLLHRVVEHTRDSGFQEEKIESLYLKLSWNASEIERILSLRTNQLFKRQYNQDRINISDILPDGQREQKKALPYILSRTFMRPREAIVFVDKCLETAVGKTKITFDVISQAEMEYSRKRLKSLCDEWIVDYSLLSYYADILHGMKKMFLFKEMLTIANLDNILLEAACVDEKKCLKDKICRVSNTYLENKSQDSEPVLKNIISHFYLVGLVGVKLAENYPVEWSYKNSPVLNPLVIKSSTKIYVHPTFWCALSISR